MKRLNTFLLSFLSYILLTFVLNSDILAQTNNDADTFLQNEVYSIYVNADPDSLMVMFETLESEHSFPANTTIISSADSINMICGLRLRGNTSLTAAKKSYRISFDSFDNNQDWRGLTDINLIALHNDPSVMRSKLCYDLFRSQGIAAPRTSYAAFYLNQQYMGIYQMTEPINEAFCKKHIDFQGDGNLFKCTYPATLEYLGSDPNLYKFEMWGQRPYELKNNEWVDDYSSLADFIAYFNNESNNFECYNENPFQFNHYITSAALEILLGHWDNYLFNKNNFYLYHNELTHKFQYIPYDVDNTLGIDWVGEDWSQRNIYQYKPTGEARPLYDAILNNASLRNQFSHEIMRLCNSVFHPDSIAIKINTLKNLISPFVASDPYYPLDYGFTYDHFLQSAEIAFGNQVQYGILPYVTARRNSALQQLEILTNNTLNLQYQYIINHPNYSELFGRIEQGVGSPPLQVEVSYDTNSPTYLDIEYLNATDFHTTLPHPDNSNLIHYRIIHNTSDVSCGISQNWITSQTDAIRINELLCENFSFNSDEFGEYEDWIELYNTSNETISLEGYYLTDDSINWNRFALPNVSMPAQSYIILWLDNDPETGNYHGTFSLSQGETISLIKRIDNLPRILESVALNACANDQSFARDHITNDWFYTTSPTPGSYNNLTTSINAVEYSDYFKVINGTIHTEEMENIKVFDISGRIVLHGDFCNNLSIAALPSGYYIIKVDKHITPIYFTNP